MVITPAMKVYLEKKVRRSHIMQRNLRGMPQDSPFSYTGGFVSRRKFTEEF